MTANLNAAHFKGWKLVLGTENHFPAIHFPTPAGYLYPRQIIVNEPISNRPVHDEVATVLAHAPEVLRRALDVLETLEDTELGNHVRVRKLRRAVNVALGELEP